MKHLFKNPLFYVCLILFLAVSFLVVDFVGATTSFSEPTELFPGGNPELPIDISSNPQFKEGELTVNGLIITPAGNTTPLYLNGSGICMKENSSAPSPVCKSYWDQITVPYATNAGTATYLKSGTDYGISASTVPSSFSRVLRHDFTSSGPNTYRTLLTISGYSRGGSQIAFPYGSYNNDLYWRRSNYASDTWESWRTIIDSSNIGSQTVYNLTTPVGAYKHIGAWGVGRTAAGAILVNTAYRADYATNAGKLGGYSLSSASTKSTVALRNSSGDINARLFRSEYDSTNASINYIMTQVDTASNNYIRPSTPAQLKAALGITLNSTQFLRSDVSDKMDTTGPTKLTIEGGGQGYINAALVLQATNDTSARGTGVFMHDAGSDNEWFAGRRYGSNDGYSILRQASVPSHDDDTASPSHGAVQLFELSPGGNLKIKGGIKLSAGRGGYGPCNSDSVGTMVYSGSHFLGCVTWNVGSTPQYAWKQLDN